MLDTESCLVHDSRRKLLDIREILRLEIGECDRLLAEWGTPKLADYDFSAEGEAVRTSFSSKD